MRDDEEKRELETWSDLPIEERKAIRRAAQSQIWWGELGRKIKALGPFVTIILAILALWQLTGEAVREWVLKQ